MIRNIMDQIFGGDVLFTFGVAVGVPYAISRWLIGASWLQTSFAYALWVTLLILIFLMPGAPPLAGAFAMIFGLLFSWLAVPFTALFCRKVNMPDRLLARWEGMAQP
jgi:hypothetical protein